MAVGIKKSRLIVAALIFGSMIVFDAQGLDLGALFNIGNLSFKPDRIPSDHSFTGAYYPWGVSVYGSESLSDTMSISAGLYNDPILRNIAYSTIAYQGDYFTLGAGPLLGVFNSTTPLNPGITASVQIRVPGIAFLSYRTDSTLGGTLAQTGDYIQSRSDIGIGYYVPNAIVSANLLTRKYTEKTSDTQNTIDQLTEYSLKTNIFQKNVPYRVLLTFGFQTLAKTFVVTDATTGKSTTTLDQLGTVIVGSRIEFHLNDAFTLIADLTSGVYTFSMDQNTVQIDTSSPPGLDGYLFQLQTGLQVSLDSLLSR